MNRKFNFVKVRQASSGRVAGAAIPGLRWRSVFSALVLLAFFMGSLGQTPPALAAPAGSSEIHFFMTATKEKNGTICVGDDVPLHVKVIRTEMTGNPGNVGYPQGVSGVTVKATTSNASVGVLNQNYVDTGWRSGDPGGADYIFRADKAGTTTISFTGTINHLWWPSILGLSTSVDRRDSVNDQVDIKVENCKYKVTTISYFDQPGIQFDALIKDGELKSDSPGHYTGTATVDWLITVAASGPSCKPQLFTSTSQADLTGVMDADGQQIKVDIVYQMARVKYSGERTDDCSPSWNATDAYTPDPLTLRVPSSGGTSRQSQMAVEPLSPLLNMSGAVKVDVIPEASQ